MWLRRLLERHWPLLVLFAIWAIILLRNLSINNYLIGWDNFSSSLDIKVNFWRTFFSTWRAYRGFGVASDSEVTDIFRQLFFAFLGLFLKKELLEQLYHLGTFGIGLAGAYLLSREVLGQIFAKTIHRQRNLISGFSALVAALFYGFNFDTLATFYLPIVIYTTRFAFFPLIIWQFVKLLSLKKIELQNWLPFAVIILFATPSYLTATVFFTLGLILASLIFAYPNRFKRLIGLLLFFIALNTFWLLPFINYTWQNSGVITRSITFSRVNEFLFNQFAERFNFIKLITFTSDFASGLVVKNIETGAPVLLHPFLKYSPIGQLPSWYYWTHLPLVAIGLFFSLYLIKRKQIKAIWPIIIAATALFFLSREYQPLGFLYEKLVDFVPFLKVVLRFGTAKMNILLVLAMTIFIAIGSVNLLAFATHLKSSWGKIVSLLLGSVIVLSVSWMSIFTFAGQMFWPVLKVNLPTSYRNIAAVINADPSPGRVLHLPLGEFGYWKSYSWGYYGSAFFNFLIEKPLLDKTFSPANLDNDFFDLAHNQLTKNITLMSEDNRELQALQLYELWKRAGVSFIVFDESVSQKIESAGLETWEYAPSAETKILIEKLVNLNKLVLEKNDGNLSLYKLTDNYQSLQIHDSAIVVDNKIENVLDTRFLHEQQPIIQANNIETQPSNINNDQLNSIDLYAKINSGNLEILAQKTLLPFEKNLRTETVILSTPISKLKFLKDNLQIPYNNFLTNWHSLGEQQAGYYRLAIGDEVLPLPASIENEKSYYFGSILTVALQKNNKINLLEASLKNDDITAFSPRFFKLTDNPNCTGDKQSTYKGTLTYKNDELVATTLDGSSCFGLNLDFAETKNSSNSAKTNNRYVEISLEAKQKTNNFDSLPKQPELLQHQQIIEEVASELPDATYLETCIKDSPNKPCLNERTAIRTNLDYKQTIVSAEHLLTGNQLQIIFTLPNFDHEEQELSLKEIKLAEFNSINSSTLDLSKIENFQADNQLTNENWPIYPAAYNYYFNPANDVLLPKYRGACLNNLSDHRINSLRLFKSFPNGGFISYINDCIQSFYVQLPYKPDLSYQWSAEYHLFNGSQPHFVSIDKLSLQKEEFLSYFEGYPNLANQKDWQKLPNLFRSRVSQKNSYLASLQNPDIITSKTTITASFADEALDKPQLFEVSQQVDNQGLLLLKNMNLVALPPVWLETISNNSLTFDTIKITDYKQFLPSLWQLTLQKPEKSENSRFLLQFGQSYNSQWKVVKNGSWQPFNLQNVKLNGWSQGWIINNDIFEQESELKLWIIYLPELLANGGWIVTGLTFIVVFIMWLVSLINKKGK